MNKTFLFAILIIFVLGLSFFVARGGKVENFNTSQTDQPSATASSTSNPQDPPKAEVIAKNLEIPWGLAFLPDGRILFTERAGRVRQIDKNGVILAEPLTTISEVKAIGEGGLLGIAVHPDFSENNFIYVYYTYSANGNNNLNRVVRLKLEGNRLTQDKVIVDAIPGASNHDGGRIKFGPDNLLYITTGDAQEPSLAQDTRSLAGKILKVTDEGQAANNPYKNLVFSFGHRNPQGIAWNDQNQLFATEHGRSGIQSGLDEFNMIESGKNYGWPTIQGDEAKPGLVPPLLNSTSDTWAPAGLAFLNKSFYFGGLRGQALYQIKFEGGPKLMTHFKNEFGRIRDVVVGPDKMLYITTSNRDGRGNPSLEDDRIIRINPDKL